MKLRVVPFFGCTLLFLFQWVSAQPLESRDFPTLASLIKADDFSDSMLNLFQRARREKKHVEKNNAVTPSVLPPGYGDFSGCEGNGGKVSAFKFHRAKKTWSDAKMSCFYEGGYLGYPDCAEEGRKYHDILRRWNSGGAWIGIHDLYEEGDWLTVLDKEMNDLYYVNWAENEPNDFGADGEDCAELGMDGRWHDKQCDREHFYFCKIDI